MVFALPARPRCSPSSTRPAPPGLSPRTAPSITAKQIHLPVAIISSITHPALPDPIVHMIGGPGGDALAEKLPLAQIAVSTASRGQPSFPCDLLAFLGRSAGKHSPGRPWVLVCRHPLTFVGSLKNRCSSSLTFFHFLEVLPAINSMKSAAGYLKTRNGSCRSG